MVFFYMFATWKKNNKFLELEQLSKPYKLTQAYTKSILKRKQADDLFPIDGISAKIANGSATPVMCTPTTPLIQVLMEKLLFKH
jgi:hypothetical protein